MKKNYTLMLLAFFMVLGAFNLNAQDTLIFIPGSATPSPSPSRNYYMIDVEYTVSDSADIWVRMIDNAAWGVYAQSEKIKVAAGTDTLRFKVENNSGIHSPEALSIGFQGLFQLKGGEVVNSTQNSYVWVAVDPSSVLVEAEDTTSAVFLGTGCAAGVYAPYDSIYAVNCINMEDTMTYDINIPKEGVYSITYLIGSDMTDLPKINMLIGGVEVASDEVPQTGWDNFVPLNSKSMVKLDSGMITVSLAAAQTWNWNLDYFTLNWESELPVEFMVEAEDTVAVLGGDTRNCSSNGPICIYNPADGITAINWVNDNDTMVYDITVPETGAYSITYNAGSNPGSGIELWIDDVKVASGMIPPGNWDVMEMIDGGEVMLEAGDFELKVTGTNAWNWNLDYIKFLKVGNGLLLERYSFDAYAAKTEDQDSEGNPRNVLSNIFDGDTLTNYANAWEADGDFPEYVDIALNGIYDLTEIIYQPRTRWSLNGALKDYQIFIVDDTTGGDWGDAVAIGSTDYPDPGSVDNSEFWVEKTITLDSTVTGSFIRVQCDSGLVSPGAAHPTQFIIAELNLRGNWIQGMYTSSYMNGGDLDTLAAGTLVPVVGKYVADGATKVEITLAMYNADMEVVDGDTLAITNLDGMINVGYAIPDTFPVAVTSDSSYMLKTTVYYGDVMYSSSASLVLKDAEKGITITDWGVEGNDMFRNTTYHVTGTYGTSGVKDVAVKLMHFADGAWATIAMEEVTMVADSLGESGPIIGVIDHDLTVPADFDLTSDYPDDNFIIQIRVNYFDGTANDIDGTSFLNKYGVVVMDSSEIVVPVESVELSEATLALVIGTNESATLTATVLPADATNPEVTWASDAEGVATVVDGVVTAVADGTANITATADGVTSTACVVTVTTKVALDPTYVANINMYPNPASEAITIDGLEAGTYTVRVVSLSGAEYINTEIEVADAANLSVSDMPAGSYIVTVVSGAEVVKSFNLSVVR